LGQAPSESETDAVTTGTASVDGGVASAGFSSAVPHPDRIAADRAERSDMRFMEIGTLL